MKFWLGVITGLGLAWAALAIWQRVPEFPDIDEHEEELEYRPGRPAFDPDAPPLIYPPHPYITNVGAP